MPSSPIRWRLILAESAMLAAMLGAMLAAWMAGP